MKGKKLAPFGKHPRNIGVRGETISKATLKLKREQHRIKPKSTSIRSNGKDWKLFLSVIGTNYTKKVREKFASLPLEHISKVHKKWFTDGRDKIALANTDMHLTTEEYRRGLQYLTSLILAKCTDNKSDLGSKILKYLHLEK